MDSIDKIEPGVVRTFRNFTGIRLVLLALSIAFPLFDQNQRFEPFPLAWLVTFLDIVLLMGYLSWSKPRRHLKSLYVPIGVIWASLGPIIETNLRLFSRISSFSPNGAFGTLLDSWQLMPILFIPLVIISWQYSSREIILFCIGTALLDATPLALQYLTTQSYFLPLLPYLVINFTRMVTFYFVGIMINNLMATQRKQKKELTQANIRISQYANTLEELTVSRERNRLARELHDVLAHTLSSVAVELEAVKALWSSDQGKAQSMLDHSLHATREGLTETRRALQELRATPLEDLGLALAVRNLAESFANRIGVSMDLQVEENLPDFPPQIQQCIYRITQEALANIAEHAGASQVGVGLTRQGRFLKLEICDNGQGFDTGSMADDHYGIKGMRERVEMIGGNFDLKSAKGSGTLITVLCGEN